MHAIHRNPGEFPDPNLYLIIDVRLVDSDGTMTPTSTPGASDQDDSGDEVDPDDQGITEIRWERKADTVLKGRLHSRVFCVRFSVRDGAASQLLP
jgi:hypothetical protein